MHKRKGSRKAQAADMMGVQGLAALCAAVQVQLRCHPRRPPPWLLLPARPFHPHRADKGGVVHAGVGKCSFKAGSLYDNAGAFAAAILAARPKGVKGGTISGYLLSASLCSSMGPGIPLNVASLVHAAQTTRKAEA